MVPYYARLLVLVAFGGGCKQQAKYIVFLSIAYLIICIMIIWLL